MGATIIKPGNIFRQRIEYGVQDTTARMHRDTYISYLNLYSAIICRMFFRDEDAIKTILFFLEKVRWQSLKSFNFFHLYTFMSASLDDPEVKKFITRNFQAIIIYLIKISPQDRLVDVKALFDVFDINYADFIAEKLNRDVVKAQIDFFFEEDIFSEMDSMYETVLNLNDVGEIRQQFEREILDLYEMMDIEGPANMHGFDDAKWESICATNYFADQMRKDDVEAGPIRRDQFL